MEKEILSVRDRYEKAFKEFFDKLYGVDLDYSQTKEYKHYLETINELDRKYGDGFDIMITIKHRYGDFQLKGIDAYTKPKSLLEINEKGVTLPDDVNSFQIDARIQVEKNGKLIYLNKADNVVFSHRILFDDFREDKKVVEDIVGKKIDKMDKRIRAFKRSDFIKFGKLIKFKTAKKENDISL